MSRLRLATILFTAAMMATAALACGDDSSTASSPTVGLILPECGLSPDGNQQVVVLVEAQVSDPDGDLATVELVLNGNAFPMVDLENGSYRYSVEADSDALIQCTAGLEVEVVATDAAGNIGRGSATIEG